MKTEDKTARLMEFVGELKQDGYKVYAPEKLTTYCHFVKDDKIGYMEVGDWGFNFGTVHKPCRECGTGFSIHREIPDPIVQMAEDCFVTAPRWAMSTDRQAVKKYTGWEEYEKLNTWAQYIEL